MRASWGTYLHEMASAIAHVAGSPQPEVRPCPRLLHYLEYGFLPIEDQVETRHATQRRAAPRQCPLRARP